MGGFFGGLIAGAVVVVALGSVLSLSTPLTRKPDVETQAPEASVAPEPSDAAKVEDAGADADLVELPPSVPESPEGDADTLAGLATDGLSPDNRPKPAASPSGPKAPDAPVAPSVTVQTEAPTALPQPVAAPASPQQDVAPEVVLETPPAPEPQEIADAVPEVKEEDVAAVPDAIEEEVADALPEEKEEDLAVLDPQDEPVLNEPEPEIVPQENPIAVEGEEDTRPRTQPRVLSLPQVTPDQPQNSGTLAARRVVPLTERDDPPTQTANEAEPVMGKPIEEYAATFDNPEAKPLMSIILIDEEGAYGAEALKDFPYPISFAVSPSDPEAGEKMERYREAGFEVLALADLPRAASAQDAEVSLSVWLDALPETVGILEGVDSGIQGNRRLADQVAAIAAGTGRGLVTQDNGLNTVQKLAARNGVPSGVVFRDFDGARQDSKVMRRFLDQAAFRAGQEGAVVMLGRLRPETISALLVWGLEDRGNRVAMAPISAVMMNAVQ